MTENELIESMEISADVSTENTNPVDDHQDTGERSTAADEEDEEANNHENEERVGLIEYERNANATVDGGEVAMMVRVRAPATLPEGFTFVAEVNEDPSKTFTCRVVSALHSVDPEKAYFRECKFTLYFMDLKIFLLSCIVCTARGRDRRRNNIFGTFAE